ncbi:MAG: fibronectin type III domain-containing protein [Ilumatobacteraceae bacterium]
MLFKRSGTVGRAVKPAHVVAVAAVLGVAAITVVAAPDQISADANEGAPGAPRRAAQVIAAGSGHSCARLVSGTVKCWGNGGSGQLGHGGTDRLGDDADEMGDNLDPVDLGTGRAATAITASGIHTYALLDDAAVKCWGWGGFGQLGHGSTDDIGDETDEMGDNLDPIDLGTGRTATATTAGRDHTCALLDDATMKCWGRGTFGPLGQGDTDNIGDETDEMGDNLDPIDLGSGTGDQVVPVTSVATAPTGASASPAAGSATVTWTAPSDDGGASVIGYRIDSATDGTTWTTQIADTGSATTTHTVTGLTPGETLQFRIAAINTVGISPWSTPTAAVAPTEPIDDTGDTGDTGVGYVGLDPARLLDTRPGAKRSPRTSRSTGSQLRLSATTSTSSASGSPTRCSGPVSSSSTPPASAASARRPPS